MLVSRLFGTQLYLDIHVMYDDKKFRLFLVGQNCLMLYAARSPNTASSSFLFLF
jgi:hypothetical protein